MRVLMPHEADALQAVTAHARQEAPASVQAIGRLFAQSGLSMPDVQSTVDALFARHRITLSFHPERVIRPGLTVLDGLMADGVYQSQFATGYTNGGRTAYPGGQRDEWERDLFFGAYHQPGASAGHRPKYGGLNLLDYLDGASPRFGSCHFILSEKAAARCTFSYGDSAANPVWRGTRAAFLPVLRALLEEAAPTERC